MKTTKTAVIFDIAEFQQLSSDLNAAAHPLLCSNAKREAKDQMNVLIDSICIMATDAAAKANKPARTKKVKGPVTELEAEVLHNIVFSEYNNRNVEDRVHVWTRSVTNGSLKLAGAISTLQRKGFVDSEGSGKNGTIWLTEEGLGVVLANGLAGEVPQASE